VPVFFCDTIDLWIQQICKRITGLSKLVMFFRSRCCGWRKSPCLNKSMFEQIHLRNDRLTTPIGELVVLTDRSGRLRAVDWTDHSDRLELLLERYYGSGGFTIEPGRDDFGHMAKFRAYFNGDLAAIETLPVETAGTAFQQIVWRALRDIPCGRTISYAELARRIGRPAAVRAVGLANGANPASIVVPCHRVIGANGSLTGYGGGIARKRWLLMHEAADLNANLFVRA
jgi:methylated-DNA-[protein]-cysteine S-methyltransferase